MERAISPRAAEAGGRWQSPPGKSNPAAFRYFLARRVSVKPVDLPALTFTLPVINAAARVMFLVSGAEKAKVLKTVLKEPTCGLPAALVHPTDGRLTWLLDRAAAALIGGAA